MEASDGSLAVLDIDGDGAPASEEFSARTNPWSSASRLDFESLEERDAGGDTVDITVTWQSVPGVTYTLWSSLDHREWTPVQGSTVTAVGPITSITYNSPSHARLFFRVQVETAP